METRTYTFVVETTISMHIDVEATSLQRAVALAQSSSTQSLCHQCARSEPNEWSTSGELDCNPVTSPLVDCYVDDETIPVEDVEW